MVTAHCMEQEEAQIRTMMLLHDQPHYHRETEGTEILSRTYESNEVLTPLQIPSRPTVSQDRYTEFRKSLHCCELPCGAEREHGGITLPALPEDHRAKDKSPCTFVKRHQHYGSGVFPWPRSLPTDQYYVTQLKKSDVRMNDELLRKPPDSSAKPLCLPFPSSHPFQTHISRYAVFPNFRSPEDRDTGVYASSHQPFHPNIPTKPFDVVVLGKTRGNAYRHEVVSIPSDSQKKAVCWPGQHGYFQLPKFAKEKSQIYYPKPPKTVAPNSTVNELEHNFSARTTNMLRNTERALGITTYHRDFTGRGPMNPLILDNYYLKEVGRLTGEVGDDVELEETFLSSLSQTRPLEGRTARLLQGRRPHESILQEQHSCSVQMPGRPELKSLPESACQSAWRPENGPRETALPECIPSWEAPRRQAALLELQHSFSKTAAHKRLHDSIRGETKDLTDNITGGRRHTFYGFNSFYFFN
ncbi:sperm-associated microtubule inner protein 4 [Columba livia]|uniref:sperm-associated microtubule inner protein 4 n=1 Tax=Columba livia TaxID=8932 RepID=UPI0031B9D5BA